MRDKLVRRVESALEKTGYRVLRYFSACFDLAAAGQKKLLVKVLCNVDGLRPEHATELKKLSCCVGAEPVVVGDRTKRSFLKDRTVYERFGVKTLSPSTFEEYVSDERAFPVYSRGRNIVRFDHVQLRMVREGSGLSLSQMAERLGVTKEAVYLYERGALRMREEVANRVYREFGVDIVKTQPGILRFPEEKLERALSLALKSFDFSVHEFDKTGFDIFAYDADNRIIFNEGVPSDPEPLVNLSRFFDGLIAFVSNSGDLDPPILPRKEVEGAGSKRELLRLLR